MATRRGRSHSGKKAQRIEPTLDFGREFGDWGEPEPEPRDLKKLFLVIGLGALSWVATYVGMLELIQANMGDLPLTTKIIIGFSVAMLMTMIIWLLDQLFSPISPTTKFVYSVGYVFLTLISVGFGFGFYWKVLESRSEATRSATSAIGEVQNSLHAATTRLEQLNITLVNLKELSSQKAVIERDTGKSCPNSRPGDGPRRKLRDADAQQFEFASDFVANRIGTVKTDMTNLDGDLAKIVNRDQSTIDAKTGTRNEYLRALNRRLDLTVTGFNAFRTDPQLRQIRTSLSERSDKTVFPNGRGGTFSCPDSQLQTALRGVVRAIDQLPELGKPKIAAVEGSEATIEAFRRLTATLYGAMTFKLPPSADELRTLQKKAVQSVRPGAQRNAQLSASEPTGLAKRDYIPLAIALFVDFCLFLVSMGRPMNRFMATKRKMMEAEMGPVFPILQRFNAIHNHDDMRATFAIFREVIFDSGGVYHVAVPLNAPQGAPNREELLQEAQTLANLCYALEGQGVLVRPWRFTPMLVAERKLRRQGSKFIECYPPASIFDRFDSDRERPAFRIYAFKNGAWPEMILGAVMGAARRMEANERLVQHNKQQAQQTEVQTTEAQPEPETFEPSTLNDGPLPVPQHASTTEEKAQPSNNRVVDPPAMAETVTPPVSETEFSAKRSDVEIEPDVKTAYGQYAARAQREILESRFRASIPSLRDADLDESTRSRRRNVHAIGQSHTFEVEPQDGAANFANEISSANTAHTTDNAEPGATAVYTVDEIIHEPSGEVVTFPAHNRRKNSEHVVSASVVQDPGISEDAQTSNKIEPPHTDVTLVRETATFSVPTSSASLPESLLRGVFKDQAELGAVTPTQIDENSSVTLEANTIEALPAPELPVTPPPIPTKVEGELESQQQHDETFAPDKTDIYAQPLFIEEDESIDVGKISERFSPPAAE